MPSYEIHYRNSDGELTLIHRTHHVDDEAVDLAAHRMMMGSGLANYEIWREEEISGAGTVAKKVAGGGPGGRPLQSGE